MKDIDLEIEGDAIVGLLKLKRMMQKNRPACTGYQYKTPIQICVLTKVFELTSYPSCRTRHDLAILINMSPRTIQIWLQNSRAAFKDILIPLDRRSTIDIDDYSVGCSRKNPNNKIKIVNTQEISARHLISLVLRCHPQNFSKKEY